MKPAQSGNQNKSHNTKHCNHTKGGPKDVRVVHQIIIIWCVISSISAARAEKDASWDQNADNVQQDEAIERNEVGIVPLCDTFVKPHTVMIELLGTVATITTM